MEKINFSHEPVLLQECIEGLNIKPDGIYVDGTLGGAGHTKKILQNLLPTGQLIGIDRDIEALDYAKQQLTKYNNVKYINDNHDNIENVLKSLSVDKVDGILLDLGVSSYQIDEASRGFSYVNDGILDMRMDTTQEITAEYIVNNYSEEELARIIYEYGEEKYSRRIAKRICEYRRNKKIETTKQLAQLVLEAIPGFSRDGGHPAKRTFQAIRIEVNDELNPLYNTIKSCIECLKTDGRLCIITFHSLEDRIVKNAYIEAEGKCSCPPNLPYCICNKKSFRKNS